MLRVAASIEAALSHACPTEISTSYDIVAGMLEPSSDASQSGDESFSEKIGTDCTG